MADPPRSCPPPKGGLRYTAVLMLALAEALLAPSLPAASAAGEAIRTAPGTAADAAGGATAIPLTSHEGQALLRRRTTLRADYPGLAAWMETQANLAYCGVASSVVALNSLAVPAPAAAGYGAYRFWTQANLFTPATTPIVRAQVVARQGMTLAELQGLLQAVLPPSTGGQANEPASRVRRYHGLDLSLAQFRLLLRRNLAEASDRLLVNYDRRLVNQQGGGHIAPLAAYEPRSDRVLILDVARYRYPAVWVESRSLWQATRGIDSSSGLSRGLVWLDP